MLIWGETRERAAGPSPLGLAALRAARELHRLETAARRPGDGQPAAAPITQEGTGETGPAPRRDAAEPTRSAAARALALARAQAHLEAAVARYCAEAEVEAED